MPKETSELHVKGTLFAAETPSTPGSDRRRLRVNCTTRIDVAESEPRQNGGPNAGPGRTPRRRPEIKAARRSFERRAVKPAITYSCPFRTTIGRAALTSEFGMGSGVAPHVLSPADHVRTARRAGRSDCTQGESENRECEDQNVNRGESDSYELSCAAQRIIKAVKRSTVSTGKLKALLPLHTRPIKQMVFLRSSAHPKGAPSPYLRDGFTLRCIQRLSIPCLATLPCR